MNQVNFYVVDTETNGLSLKLHEICQISIIRVEDRMQLTRDIKVNKVEHSSWDALKITGKTMNDLRFGMDKSSAIKEVEEFLSEDGASSTHRCLIAHNAAFDRKFLCALWEQFGKKFPFDLSVDTIQMFRAYCKKQGIQKPKVNLGAACESLGIKKYGQSHDALVDTRHTYLLFQELSKSLHWLDFVKNQPHNIELR